jgi:hypothetical protein
MRHAARVRALQREISQDVGTVVRVEGRTFVTRTETGECQANRATSCLLEPAVGDVVLLALVSTGPVYVLAVLEREPGAPATIAMDGNLEVKLPAGALGLAAQDGVRLVSGKDVSVVCGEIGVNAVDGRVALRRLSFVGDFLSAELERVKVFAGTLDSVLDRLSQKVKRSYRVVEETDHLRAERIDHAAKKSLSLRAESAHITAEELVKIDGDQIHLG